MKSCVTVALDADLLEIVDGEAKRADASRSWVVGRLLRRALDAGPAHRDAIDALHESSNPHMRIAHHG